MKPRKKAQFPRHLKPIFWDTSLTQLDSKKNAKYIIARVLQWGTERDYAWLKDQYPPTTIKKSLAGVRSLDRKSYCFWSLVLGVSSPKRQRSSLWKSKQLKKKPSAFSGR